MKKILLVSSLFFLSATSMAQSFSDSVEVRSIETLAESNTTFIRATTGWGLEGCEAAQFVNITDASASYSEMLATALTARASGINLTARGVCSASGNSVVAERLRLD